MTGASGDLHGLRVLVTRPAAQAAGMLAAIRDRGGHAVAVPLLEIVPLPLAELALEAPLARLAAGAVAIFISTNAVAALFAALAAHGRAFPAAGRCIAVGAATAAAVRRHGVPCRAATGAMNSEELLAMPELAAVAGCPVVIFKGQGGRALLAEALRARGAEVSECPLYRRVLPDAASRALPGILAHEAIGAVMVSSGETLQHLVALLGPGAAGTIAAGITLVVPGERVAALARQHGFSRVRVAHAATDAAMLDELAHLAATGYDRPEIA